MASTSIQQKLNAILKEAKSKDQKGTTVQSIRWFHQKVRKELGGSIQAREIIKSANEQHDILPDSVSETIGHLWLFNYDPKYKAKLPYYDVFPVIMLINQDGRHFDGLNFHYLPYTLRYTFFTRLLKYKRGADKTERIKITYDILKATKALNLFKPTYKKYLLEQVRGKMIHIPTIEWPLLLGLPIAKWIKSNERKVWKDSREKLRG